MLFAELLTVVQGARCSLGARSKSDHNQQWLHLNEGVCALPSQTKIIVNDLIIKMAMLLIKCWQSYASRGAEQPLTGCGEHVDEDCDADDDDDD